MRCLGWSPFDFTVGAVVARLLMVLFFAVVEEEKETEESGSSVGSLPRIADGLYTPSSRCLWLRTNDLPPIKGERSEAIEDVRE